MDHLLPGNSSTAGAASELDEQEQQRVEQLARFQVRRVWGSWLTALNTIGAVLSALWHFMQPLRQWWQWLDERSVIDGGCASPFKSWHTST
jgi:hypothetical protein